MDYYCEEAEFHHQSSQSCAIGKILDHHRYFRHNLRRCELDHHLEGFETVLYPLWHFTHFIKSKVGLLLFATKGTVRAIYRRTF